MSNPSHHEEHIPVLIVGGSLVGLSLALFLSRRDIPCLLVERHARVSPPLGAPRDQLRSHLRSLQLLMREEPALFIALNEIEQRALRDPAICAVTQQQTEEWHAFLVRILKAGITQGNWPEDLDAEATASAIIALMNGLNIRLSPERAEQAIRQLERWLMN